MGENTSRHSYRYWITVILFANVLLVGLTVFIARLLSPAPDIIFLASGTRCITCWQGISPGKTNILEVSGLLTNSGLNFEIPPEGSRNAIAVEAPHGWLKAFMYPGFAGFRADPHIAMFCLRDDDQTGGLILADILNELGPPDDAHFEDTGLDKIRINLRYRLRQIEIRLVFARVVGRFTLSNPI